jgi:protoporphyrinogen oxidase
MPSPRTPVIIGAGPAGLSAAYELSRAGVASVVLEASADRVGGLSQTVEYRGYRFDIGGHRFFSKNAEIEQLWTDVVGADMLEVPRRSRIYYNRRFFDYPLRPLNAFLNLGPLETARCVLSYLWAVLMPRRPVVSFEDWVTNQFGERLYRIFFKTYTEKVWGIPCSAISADWAAQRIKNLNLLEAVRNALLGRGEGDVVSTLIDTFRYPRLGPGMMWEKLANLLRQRGCDIRMGTPVRRIVRDGAGARRVIYGRADGSEDGVDASHVISSMPLGQLAACLEPAPPPGVLEAAHGLTHRDFITVALIVDDAELFPDNWIYIHDPSVRVGRVQNYRNWSLDMVADRRHSCLGLEYFCFAGDGLWTSSDADLIELAKRELAQLQLVEPSRVVDGTVVRMPRAYPVYDRDYRERVATVRHFLESEVPNVHPVGRNGMHRYNNQDHAMYTGILAARNVLGGAYDPWKVNGDAIYIEDGSGDESEARAVPRTTSP